MDSNVCYSAFIEPRNLADVLLEIQRPNVMPRLDKSLVGSIKVRTQHLGHKKKLFSIGTNTARNQFLMVDGKKKSVEQYFKEST